MISIFEVPFVCIECDWRGIAGECEPDCDGEGSLGCPECGALCEQVLEDKRPETRRGVSLRDKGIVHAS